MKTANLVRITMSILLVNILIGHFFPPCGILLTPLILIIIAMIIYLKENKLNLTWKSIFLAILICLHDIGIKLFSGGTHDTQGLGFIHLMLFVGLIPILGLITFQVFKKRKDKEQGDWTSIIMFISIVFIHLLFFEKLGV